MPMYNQGPLVSYGPRIRACLLGRNSLTSPCPAAPAFTLIPGLYEKCTICSFLCLSEFCPRRINVYLSQLIHATITQARMLLELWSIWYKGFWKWIFLLVCMLHQRKIGDVLQGQLKCLSPARSHDSHATRCRCHMTWHYWQEQVLTWKKHIHISLLKLPSKVKDAFESERSSQENGRRQAG